MSKQQNYYDMFVMNEHNEKTSSEKNWDNQGDAFSCHGTYIRFSSAGSKMYERKFKEALAKVEKAFK